MKTRFLSPVVLSLAAVLSFHAPLLRADDAPEKPAAEEKTDKEKDADGEKEEDADAEEGADGEMSKEEREKAFKERQEAEKAAVAKMMRAFQPLEGEWTGEERLEFTDPNVETIKWHDEWTGVFTMGGRYFEMHGQTSGDNESEYKWICTWDAGLEKYRAWYFGETSQNGYIGELSGDGKNVVWRNRSEEGIENEFTMKADGNRVKCEGEEKVGLNVFSRQLSSYTRKRLGL